jgi:hypothetical protein
MRKSEVDDSSSSKYVPPYRRHIKGKGDVICKNSNYNSAENVKKLAHLPSLQHHRSHPTQVSTAPGSKAKEAANKSYIREQSTSYGSSSSTASAEVCSYQSELQKQRKTNQCTTRESRRSPMAAMAMKDC